MFARAAQSPDLIERFKSQGVTLSTTSPAEFAVQIVKDGERLGVVSRASGIRAD